MDPTLIAIAIGLIVSLIVTEVLGLSVGGMIVPGYLAMSLHEPLAVGMTILAAAVAWALVRLVSRWTILYGRRRVVLTVMFGFAVGMAIRTLANVVGSQVVGGQAEMDAMVMIGFIIPGLIALWFERQGFIETVSPMMSAAVLVRLVLILCGLEALS